MTDIATIRMANQYSIDVNLDLSSEEYVTEVEHELVNLTEDELAELLQSGDEIILQEDIFDVPLESIQPLFLCFVQRCIKLVLHYSTELASIKLEDGLDTIYKLLNKAAPDEATYLHRAVVMQHPTAVSVFLDFVLRIWQGRLVDVDADEMEENSKSLIRFIWNLLDSYEGNVLLVVTPNLLRDLVECLGKFQNAILSPEAHTFISLYIIKILRTIAAEHCISQQLVEWNCPNSLVELLPSESIEVDILIKSLAGRLIPYCGPAQAENLREAIRMTEENLSFILCTLVPMCEMDDQTRTVKIRRILSMIRDLVTNRANQKALLDNDAQEVLLKLAEDDDDLKKEVIASLSPDIAASHTVVPVNSNSLSQHATEESKVAVKQDTACGQEILSVFPLDDGTPELVNGIFVHLVKCVSALQQCIESDVVDDALVVQAMTLCNMLHNAVCIGSEWHRPIADHIAQDPLSVESLCKLLDICYAHNFSKETLAVAFTTSDFIETCLVQWTHHSSAMCHAVCAADLVYYLLSTLNRKKEKVFDENEIQCVERLLCILLNIARHEENVPAFYSADITMRILIPYSHCSLGKIGLYVKCVLSFLQLLMNDDELQNLELTAEEMTFFANALNIILTSEEDTASGLSVEEILVILTNVSSVGSNLFLIGAKPEIHSALEETVLSTVDCIRKRSVYLLVNLIQNTMTWNIPQTTIQALMSFEEDTSMVVHWPMIHCLLHCLKGPAQDDIHGCSLCCEGFYQLGKYEECINKCNPIISKAKQVKVEQDMLNKVKLLKGKSLFHSYQKQQIQFMRERQHLSEREISDRINHVYSKTKESILLLGNALDNGFLDDEGSRLLDFAMMDYMRETNKLHDCRRCLLCRERKERNDIQLSHFIPKSILKKIGKEYIADGDHKFLLPVDGRIAFHSAGECTFRMLCKVCEQRLSQNGETIFTERFFPKVYNDDGPVVSKSDTVQYGSWLYSFCLGMIFRGLATERFAAVMNVNEVYKTFLACREHLTQLSAKVTKHDEMPDHKPISHSLITGKKLEVYFLINPVTVDDKGDGIRLKQLAAILQGTGSPFLSAVRLHDGKASLAMTAHFFTAHFGSCNIIVKFQPSIMAELPSWSMVDPEGGVYKIHEEDQRWEHFPAGFWSAQLFATYKFETVSLNYYTSTKTRDRPRKDPDKSDLVPGVPESAEITDVFSSARETPNIDRSFFSDFCSAPFVVNLLPNGYRIAKLGSGYICSISLPRNHQYILHSTITTSEEKCATIILAINTATLGIYIIAAFSSKKGQMIDWIDEKCTENIVIRHKTDDLSFLERETQKKMLEILPQVLKAKGVYSIQSVIQQVKCRVQCNDKCFSMDQKCIGSCWYCTDSCNACMVHTAVPGLSMAENIDGSTMILKHCSKTCLEKFSLETLSFPAEIVRPTLCGEPPYCIFKVNKMVQTTGNTLTHVTMHVCVDGSNDVDMKIFVVVHLCSRMSLK